ncbi:hypothetical protein CC86DRAFT_329486 [Ophiobolus disseminans]|uniref:Uncharacterized protein n=1 Tax=Ophiobolus disseminans TaxID=1469910 RepID=A0A6A6ZR95_9PLEO|nr:hypothetical protein CC86DRAFT_329486 [Ophiobolus disseminans]
MAANLDTRRVRSCAPCELRDYYKELQNGSMVELVTQQILNAIERGSIPPKTYKTWLGVSKSPSVVAQGLQQSFSVLVRRHSLNCFGKLLCSKKWKYTWDGLGGTQGFLDLFSDFSVDEVREVCKILGKIGKGEDMKEKRECITELFMGLQPSLYPDVHFMTNDKRPLARYYHYLIPGCTPGLVKQILDFGSGFELKAGIHKSLAQYHPDVVRAQQLQALGNNAVPFNRQRLKYLFTQYPQTPSHGIQGFSASMEFALATLRTVVNTDAHSEDGSVVHDIVQPLLRRALKKKAEWSQIEEIVALTKQYMEKHKHAGRLITTTRACDVLHQIAICWVHQPEKFEKHLKRICSHPISGTRMYDKLTDWEDFLDGVPLNRRYALLRLCFQASTGLDIDMEYDLRNMRGSLSDALLDRLQPNEAFTLYSQLRAARGAENLITTPKMGYTILTAASTYGGSGVDPDLYQVMLLSRNNDLDTAHNFAVQKIDNHKYKAKIAAGPEQRAFHAKTAVYYAIASGDLQLYHSVLKWTKRFRRDNFVIRELYPTHHPQEVVEVLSGIPERASVYTTSEIRAKVVTGNAILQDMFECGCADISEPSFHPGYWHATLSLFQYVVQERIDRSKRLKHALGLSDDEWYTILWEDTIRMLLDVEKQSHLPEYKALKADTVDGPLALGGLSRIVLDSPQPSTCKFLDNLAKLRDQYWQKLRVTISPAVSTLPKPFPRGLPIHSLIAPFQIDTSNLEVLAPYLASRTHAALFLDPVDALLPFPQDDETKAAGHTFVDGFRSALTFYIPKTYNQQEKEQRFRKVWEHAVGPLSQGRMSEEEAVRFWCCQRIDSCKSWPQVTKYRAAETAWPKIPEVENSADGHAWNPLDKAFGRLDHVSRDLGALTYLDVSLAIHTGLRSSIFPPPNPVVYGDQDLMNSIWDSSRDIGEGGVLSALLYLEVLHGASGSRLLEKPFPSEDDPRYPVLYLDSQFQADLKTCGVENACSVRKFGKHLKSFPPTLLHHAAKNIMGRYRASDQENGGTRIELHALETLFCFTGCDRPALAKELVLNIILDSPRASSWHRHLLSPKFLRRLPPKDAKWCLETFADVVFERMHTQDDDKSEPARVGESKPTDQSDAQLSPPKPSLKITTIKLLAQRLQDTGVIDDTHTFALLSTLITTASHIDVRLQTTKGLLDKFASCRSDLCEKILAPIESIIPLAGNLNERSPITESDWVTAEQTFALPEYPDIGHTAPLFHALVDYYRKLSDDEDRLKRFINRILLPTVSYLKQQTARWLTIFLKKHGITEPDLSIPAIPYRSGRITALLKEDGVRYLPRTLIHDLTAYSTFRLAPPAPIAAMNKRLLADKTLLAQKDVQAWFEVYSTRVDASLNFGLFDVAEKPTSLDEDVGITTDVVREHVLAIFKVVVSVDAPTYTHTTGALLRDVLNGAYFLQPWWRTHGVAAVQAMITHVESLRTMEWERNPNRIPAVLPDTFAWRLAVLDFPIPVEDDEDEGRCERFAGQVGNVVEDIVGGIALYHDKLATLKTYLSIDTTTYTADPHPLHISLLRNRLLIAMHLGDISKTRLSFITSSEVLRVDVAHFLLQLVAETDWWERAVSKKIKERVVALVDMWKNSSSEEVRRMGWGVEGMVGRGERRTVGQAISSVQWADDD